MTAKQFTAALDALGIESNRDAARILGVGRNTVTRYCHGQTAVPESVRRLLDMLTRYGIPKEYAS